MKFLGIEIRRAKPPKGDKLEKMNDGIILVFQEILAHRDDRALVMEILQGMAFTRDEFKAALDRTGYMVEPLMEIFDELEERNAAR